MIVKKDMLEKLETLGFRVCGQDNLYYEKHFGYGKFIRVGDPYYDNCYVEFYHDVGEWGETTEEITKYVPMWAFKTIVEMINMGMIEE